MLTSRTTQRLGLLKKSIEFQQHEIQSQLLNIQNAINKKNTSIVVLDNYLKETAQHLSRTEPQTPGRFINQQLFLNQIASVVHTEKSTIKSLQTKQENLKQTFGTNKQKTDILNEYVQDIKSAIWQSLDKKQEHITNEEHVARWFQKK